LVDIDSSWVSRKLAQTLKNSGIVAAAYSVVGGTGPAPQIDYIKPS